MKKYMFLCIFMICIFINSPISFMSDYCQTDKYCTSLMVKQFKTSMNENQEQLVNKMGKRGIYGPFTNTCGGLIKMSKLRLIIFTLEFVIFFKGPLPYKGQKC